MHHRWAIGTTCLEASVTRPLAEVYSAWLRHHGRDGRSHKDAVIRSVAAPVVVIRTGRFVTMGSGGRLPGDDCDRDWIWSREAETAPAQETFGRAAQAWRAQASHIQENSGFYRRKFREAEVGRSPVRLEDLPRLPFTSKEELKQAIEEEPPFGTNRFTRQR